ncbi:hypothetical protein Q4485_12440 [Granulosicoccaceae sp. 1_MG-2023]|nr:hypothetical protein [Granulosicoccaceae sp. 1_MG-2023]
MRNLVHTITGSFLALLIVTFILDWLDIGLREIFIFIGILLAAGIILGLIEAQNESNQETESPDQDHGALHAEVSGTVDNYIPGTADVKSRGHHSAERRSDIRKESATILCSPATQNITNSSPTTRQAVGAYHNVRITRGLIIMEDPLRQILDGAKTWEMRSKHIRTLGPIALIMKGTKQVWGVATITDSLGMLSEEQMLANIDKHRITTERLKDPKIAKWRYAWVLKDVVALEKPIPYTHKKGAVTFVALDKDVTEQICEQLKHLEKATCANPNLSGMRPDIIL